MSAEDDLKDGAIRILDRRRILAVSTAAADGWPHTTIVGYANVGLTIYFAILRTSEKFGHIRDDNRISFAVGEEPRDPAELQEVYGRALASVVEDEGERSDAWALLASRHGNIARSNVPDPETAVLIRADPKHLTVLDYVQAFGRSEAFDVA